MTMKIDKYPNEDDYKPYVDKNMPDELYELPLSDPAPSHTVSTYRSYVPDEEQVSAFAENKKRG